MNYATPFIVRDGIFHDRFFMPLKLNCEDINYPEEIIDFSKLVRESVNTICINIDDSAIADADGFISEEALKNFDKAVDCAFKSGIYIVLRPFIKGTAKGLDQKLFTRQQRYLSCLFTRRNSISGKCLYEYENLAALEMVFDPSDFEEKHLDLYCGRGMMEVFIEHYFNHRVVKIYDLKRGEPDESQRKIMERHHIKFLEPDVLKKRDSGQLKFETHMPGIPDSVVRGGIREQCATGWSPIGVADCMSIIEDPHANGGGEGWLTYASDVPVEVRLDFPALVKTAKFRPSMKESLNAVINGNSVELSIPSARYGTLEINYGEDEETPVYTVHILGDNIASDPAESSNASNRIKFIEPGLHAPEDIVCGAAETVYFQPGLHEIEGGKVSLESGKNVYISRGAVVRAGIIAEEVSDAKILGQGILDGTVSPRDVGENKGDRMGEKWIEDAGREGFVCFYKGERIVWDGPVIYNSNYWNIVISGTVDAVVRNHKAITWLQNTDGIQPRSCVNLLVEHCFLKCADDCIAVKTRRTLGMESRNIVFRDLTLWHDRVGSGLQIGHTSQADILENVSFSDIYAIHGGHAGHVLGMRIIDHETVRNTLYENIYVEGVPFGCDFSFSIGPSYYTTDDERGRIEGVVVRNYFSEKLIENNSLIAGFDPEHKVKNVLFGEIYGDCGKQRINNPDEIVGSCEHSDNIAVK